MPVRKQWTETEDALIRKMEAAGRSTDDIARIIGVSRTTVRHRGQRIGITRWTGHKPPAHRERSETELQPYVDYHRAPLPAGHPISWGAIVAGTSLDGLEYQP